MRHTSTMELVCKSGHRSDHLLDRVLRLNDAWCPKCGADLKYTPAEEAAPAEPAVLPAAAKARRIVQSIAD